MANTVGLSPILIVTGGLFQEITYFFLLCKEEGYIDLCPTIPELCFQWFPSFK